MSFIADVGKKFSRRARDRRALKFRATFDLNESTRVLDLGSENGGYISQVLTGTGVDPRNVYIADIDSAAVAEGASIFGFNPVVLAEDGTLPFPDGFFDIVHCSSVIEHVSIPKAEVWSVKSGKQFRLLADANQRRFAAEVIRVCEKYWVQTPNKWFPVESHSWLPFIGWLPRSAQLAILRRTNRFWVKKTSPDWHLLDAKGLSRLFGESPIIEEKALGLTKSITACNA